MNQEVIVCTFWEEPAITNSHHKQSNFLLPAVLDTVTRAQSTIGRSAFKFAAQQSVALPAARQTFVFTSGSSSALLFQQRISLEIIFRHLSRSRSWMWGIREARNLRALRMIVIHEKAEVKRGR
jgi:hypothetical protein